MAPEIQTGAYTYSSDMFGFGIIIFEVFNERLPDYDNYSRCATVPVESIGYNIIRDCIKKVRRLSVS
jgi:serine/threonine protein kinase